MLIGKTTAPPKKYNNTNKQIKEETKNDQLRRNPCVTLKTHGQ